jgi:hypothetical protein
VSPITAAAPLATTLIMPESEAEHAHPVLRRYQEIFGKHLKEAAQRDNLSQSSTAKYEIHGGERK